MSDTIQHLIPVAVAYFIIRKFFSNKESQKENKGNTDEINTPLGKCKICGCENKDNAKFCRSCGKQMGTKERINISSSEPTKSIFGCVSILVAYIAKADGVISQNEAKIISEVLTNISAGNSSLRGILKSIYEDAKSDPFKEHIKVTNIMLAILEKEFARKEREEFCMLLMNWFVALVYADGTQNIKQSFVVNDIASVLGVDKNLLMSLYSRFEEFKKDSSNTNNCSSDTIDYYEILKSKPNDSDEQIKSAYKSLAKQYHPDIINSKDLAEDFILFANQKFKEINSAYEHIKRQRGMK